MKSYFVSYNRSDREWAEWIAWVIEACGHRAVIQVWDFVPGGSWTQEMQNAVRDCDATICVLSPDFLASGFAASEWQVAFSDDPTGAKRKLIPVRVRECEPDGLLKTRVYVDLVGKDPEAARESLSRALLGKRAKPEVEPQFPGPPEPAFPAESPAPGASAHTRTPPAMSRTRRRWTMTHSIVAGLAVFVLAVALWASGMLSAPGSQVTLRPDPGEKVESPPVGPSPALAAGLPQPANVELRVSNPNRTGAVLSIAVPGAPARRQQIAPQSEQMVSAPAGTTIVATIQGATHRYSIEGIGSQEWALPLMASRPSVTQPAPGPATPTEQPPPPVASTPPSPQPIPTPALEPSPPPRPSLAELRTRALAAAIRLEGPSGARYARMALEGIFRYGGARLQSLTPRSTIETLQQEIGRASEAQLADLLQLLP